MAGNRQSSILLENSREFFETGKDCFKKERYNAATDSFFKAIVTLCDFAIYNKVHALPNDHKERFGMLKAHYPSAYHVVSKLFGIYRRTYNLKASKEDAKLIREKYEEIAKYFGIEE